MLRSLGTGCLLYLAFAYVAVLPSRAQEVAPAPSQASSPKPADIDYPESTHGLEHLAKDIIKAQKEGHSSRAAELAQSMVLPDPAAGTCKHLVRISLATKAPSTQLGSKPFLQRFSSSSLTRFKTISRM